MNQASTLPFNFRMHHVGCLVEDIPEAIEDYRTGLGFQDVSDIYEISSQRVRVCFVDVGTGVYVELVEVLEENALSAMFARGTHYYHVGYLTDDFDGALEHLEEIGYLKLSTFHSEAFDGRRCAFLLNTQRTMIELIEDVPGAAE